MATTTVTVGSSIGLHARPAGIIADAVTEAGTPVTLAIAGGEPIDGGSALLIMSLGATQGTEVTVECDDPATLAAIADLVAADLDA
ncbi:MAG: HPr family phosphocarrier protein [Rhodococcus sp.]|nr:HPr family phosphocarrier protein [Rhodococcus sp. (in: high G+C Gram-positive bacteria)]